MFEEFGFEAAPFDGPTEVEGEVFEWGRRRAPSARRPRPNVRSAPRGRRPRPSAAPRRLPSARPIGRRPRLLAPLPFPVEPVGSERVRWLQDCLNLALGTRLPVTGVMGPETRSALRSFQRRDGLRVSGIAGPHTEKALQSICRAPSRAVPVEEEGAWSITSRRPYAGFDEEYQVTGTCRIEIDSYENRDLARPEDWDNMYRGSGVYAIRFGTGRVCYVGKSGPGNGVRNRFRGRRQSLRELCVPLKDLRPRVANIYTVRADKGTCRFGFRNDRGRPFSDRAVNQGSLVEIAEVALIRHLDPIANDRTRLQEVQIGAGSRLVVRLNRQPIFDSNQNGSTLSGRR